MGPIGVFDSGYGGLTILKEMRERLPAYDFLYLGDNARAPYGARSFEVVYDFTLEAVEELFSRGCELVILACNTASAKALRTIQQNDLPKMAPNKRVLGVIRPSTEIIGELSHSGKVGVLATEGTVKSNSYVIEIGKFSPSTKVYQQACPLWVPLIENNKYTTEAGRAFIQEDVLNLLAQDPEIDVLILGCTHYPIVQDFIASIVPPHVQLFAQGQIVADRLSTYLQRHPEIDEVCSKSGEVKYLTTENAATFDANAIAFLGETIQSTHIKLGEVQRTDE
ncbi:MAG: glutamate racemase [Bacteroidetes bacterium RIFCSPHIGHO2_02_FULL_44_7]|nr:MAG: glutamate racemase [Bacteroidetes bacterium RIFCSPHIGHO2_02_FULL_44_7]